MPDGHPPFKFRAAPDVVVKDNPGKLKKHIDPTTTMVQFSAALYPSAVMMVADAAYKDESAPPEFTLIEGVASVSLQVTAPVRVLVPSTVKLVPTLNCRPLE